MTLDVEEVKPATDVPDGSESEPHVSPHREEVVDCFLQAERDVRWLRKRLLSERGESRNAPRCPRLSWLPRPLHLLGTVLQQPLASVALGSWSLGLS